jgi:hypothetical protein
MSDMATMPDPLARLLTGLSDRALRTWRHLRTVVTRHPAASVTVPPAEVPVLARPTQNYQGRPVLVVSSLGSLRGPASGHVRLPRRVFWSGTDDAGVFDLGDQADREALYRTVIREARLAEDLTGNLDGATLIALWPRLVLRMPRPVRHAWETQHDQLRDAAAAGSESLPVAS